MYRFPYYKNRPHIPIIVEFGSKRERALPLLDSGADFTVFHKQDALDLGLDWESGKDRLFDSAYSSGIPVKEFLVSLELEDIRFPARVCFADNADFYHRPLLGRADVFDKFRITFAEREQLVEVEPLNES